MTNGKGYLMAHKLTEQEQATVVRLAKFLGKELPVKFRGNAGGIASGLVRLRGQIVAEKDVRTVLERYDAAALPTDTLVELGVLVPVTNGGFTLEVPERRAIAKAERPRPPAKRDGRAISRLDTVRKQTPELTDIRLKIIELDPRLWINGWLLSTPDAYVRYERELRALDAALAGEPTLGDGTLSLRELSYQVFGDEKFLALESEGRKLLHLMGLLDLVSCRPQAKLELMHHIPKHHRHLRIIVSENLDPWVNMRNAMFLDGRKRLFGERIHGVVFGNGYIVDDPHKLPDLLATMDAEDVEVLYWGDIDRAGLQILSKLAEMASDDLAVRPLIPAYRLMLKRAMRHFADPLENEQTDQIGVPVRGLDLFEGELKERELAYLRAVLDGARLIPQEILTARDLG